jgi:hypothetical protein
MLAARRDILAYVPGGSPPDERRRVVNSFLIRIATVWILTCAAVLASIPADARAPRASAAHADPRPWARGVPAREQQLALALFAAGNREFVESRFTQALASTARRSCTGTILRSASTWRNA